MAFYAYLLRCRDGTYYAGHTEDLDQRMASHQSGAMGGYTATRRPVTLVWHEAFQTRDDAFAVERKLKGWGRAKKEALIAGDWSRVQALARNRQGGRLVGQPSAGILRQAQDERGGVMGAKELPVEAAADFITERAENAKRANLLPFLERAKHLPPPPGDELN